jgi:serine/threonine protein kinase
MIAGRYRVQRVLGEGTWARTLLAEDTTESRQVAIKELRVELLDDWKHVELFQREARVLKLIDNPGVPRVYEVIEAESETGKPSLCLVQEWIEGRSLREHIEHGPLLGEVEIEQITRGVLDVLEHLHSRIPPVYHRDIKPSNIMVRPDGTPVLIDFGGVCFGWRQQDKLGSTVVGTFGYMPPEQLLGHVGPRADLYAFGATLLHVLTGIPPHDFPFDTGRIEVPRDLPAPRLRRLVHALLEPAPRDRPASSAAARALLQGEPAAASTAALVLAQPSVPAVLAGDSPRYVDVGAPPRDPRGEFADVYLGLTDPINYLRKAPSALGKLGAFMGLGVLSLCTFGVVPLWWLSDRKGRRNSFERLFREGELVRGSIVACTKHDGEGTIYATFKYAYEVDGVSYRGFMLYEVDLLRYFSEGDPVAVLYDRDDPTQSCFVFRRVLASSRRRA